MSDVKYHKFADGVVKETVEIVPGFVYADLDERGKAIGIEVLGHPRASMGKAPDRHVRITPAAYLRTILSMVWACVRHPLSHTVIDMTTGRIVPPQEKQEGRQ